MINQRTKSIVAIFIVIASFIVSFVTAANTGNVQAVCEDDDKITITRNEMTVYKSLKYTRGGITTWTEVNNADNKYVIPGTDTATTANIRFFITDDVSGDVQYEITCVGKEGKVKAVDVTIRAATADTIEGTSSVTMTVNPATFDLTKTSSIKITLPKGFEKAIIASCEIYAPSVARWVSIHDCDVTGNNIVTMKTYIKNSMELEATMRQVRIGDDSTLNIRCKYDACEAGKCEGFERTYPGDVCKA